MAVDFSNLLKRPMGTALKPAVLPVGDYPGIIKKYEYGDQNQNKTPYLRLQVAPLDWPQNIQESEKGQTGPDGTFHPTDLSKRTLRKDFYLTDDAMWRLEDLLKSCGLTDGDYDSLIPQLVGKNVTIAINQYVSQKSGELGNDVAGLTGVGS